MLSYQRNESRQSNRRVTNLDALPYHEADQECDRLERAFNRRFSAALSAHFRTCHSQKLATVFWSDERSILNAERVATYLSPWNDHSAPWILRICFNRSCGLLVPKSVYSRLGASIPDDWVVGRKMCWQNETGWHFELSVLPQQLLDLPEWVATWVAHRSDTSIPLPQPPHQCETDDSRDRFYGWTTEARAAMNAFQRLNARPKKNQPSSSNEMCSINWILD